MKQHKNIWIAATLVSMLALAACNTNQPGATSSPSEPSVQETATTDAGVIAKSPTTVAPTVGAETTATSDPAASGQATTEPSATTAASGEATPMATTEPGAQTGVSPTVLSGSAITFEGVNIEVDNAMIPSVAAYTGPVHQNMTGMDNSALMSGAGNLTGTVLTLSGFSADPAASTFFEPRIIVVPVSHYSSMANVMTNTNTMTSTGTMTSTDMMTSTSPMTATDMMTSSEGTATAMPSASGMGAGSVSDGISFVQLLSTTLNSRDNLESSTLSETMILANPMTFIPKSGVQPVVQTNGKRLDFQNGKGVRFVTAFGEGQGGLSNDSLYYVFNGLTDDGLYHVSAILPITSTLFAATRNDAAPSGGLAYPANADASGFREYLNQAVQSLDDASSNGDEFAKALERYDALMGSLRIEGTISP